MADAKLDLPDDPILSFKSLSPKFPEDLYHLIKKAMAIRKHLERNRKDKDSKFGLILVESRIHRLARYYKKTKKLFPIWKYPFPSLFILKMEKICKEDGDVNAV